jgi:hypothetical protein
MVNSRLIVDEELEKYEMKLWRQILNYCLSIYPKKVRKTMKKRIYQLWSQLEPGTSKIRTRNANHLAAMLGSKSIPKGSKQTCSINLRAHTN